VKAADELVRIAGQVPTTFVDNIGLFGPPLAS
jgi:hypothetical protein